MVNIEAEPRPTAGGCPLEHLQVTIRIAERGEGTPANMHLDADGLALPVVNEVDFRQTHKYRLPVLQLELCPDAGANHLLRRDAINPFAEDAHELDPAGGNDERLKSVRAQVGEQFEH